MPFKIHFVDIIFSFTIFGLLVYKLCFLIKQHLIPFLHKQVKQEREAQTNLIEKENLIISNQHRIETQIRQQNRTFDTLEKNMQAWHNFLLKQKNSKENDYKNIIKLLEEKRKNQQKNYELMYISKETLPRAITLAETELKNKYSGKNGSSKFDHLIAQLSTKN